MLQVLANIDTNLTYTCGDIGVSFSGMFPYIISVLVLIIKIAVPIILIIFGMLDLAKAIMAQKEDEIKKGQQTFIKRLIAAVIVFLVAVIVPLVIKIVAPKDDNANMWNCVDCLINYSETNQNCATEKTEG